MSLLIDRERNLIAFSGYIPRWLIDDEGRREIQERTEHHRRSLATA